MPLTRHVFAIVLEQIVELAKQNRIRIQTEALLKLVYCKIINLTLLLLENLADAIGSHCESLFKEIANILPEIGHLSPVGFLQFLC